MKLTIGDRLYVSVDPALNRLDYATGFVVAINDDDTVNLRVLPNGPNLHYATDVTVHPTEEDARAWLASDASGSASAHVAWPRPADVARDKAIAAMAELLADVPREEPDQDVTAADALAADALVPGRAAAGDLVVVTGV